MSDTTAQNGIAKITLDAASLAPVSVEAEHEQRAAIYDLTEQNVFELAGGPEGPYEVVLSTQDNKLVFDITSQINQQQQFLALSLTPFKRIVRDYLMMCDSYYSAIHEARPEQIETVDMARRAAHNEGAQLLTERLEGKVRTDNDTARRLFTLLCALFRPR